MYNKTLICVQRLCRIRIIADYTGVGLGRFHCICLLEELDRNIKV